jgi:two-component system, NarL family, nitrate/nitrite response regulator NarL
LNSVCLPDFAASTVLPSSSAASETRIRIVIVDDHPVFRYGLRELLGTQPDLAVVGEAASSDEAVQLVNQLSPAILLLDLSMPGGSGLETLRRLRDRSGLHTIVLTAAICRHERASALKLGARGIVLKDSPTPLLFKSIRSVFAGELWLRRQDLVDAVDALRTAPDEGRERSAIRLTAREREVLELVATAQSNRDIARALSVSEDTVKHHLTNIFDKTGVSNRLELTLFAIQHQLIKSV